MFLVLEDQVLDHLVGLGLDLVGFPAFHPGVEPQVLVDSQFVEEDVVLGADPEGLPNRVHVRPDIHTVDLGRAIGGRKEAG